MGPEIRAENSKKVVCGTYDFLSEPGNFMCTIRLCILDIYGHFDFCDLTKKLLIF